MTLLARDTIERALELLSRRLEASEQRAALFLVGGAVMCLVYRCSMTARELVTLVKEDPERYQLHINGFIDAFRRVTREEGQAMVGVGPESDGRFEGLVSAVSSALCREKDIPAPDWVRVTRSPEPFFVLPAKGYALRIRLLIESPPPFRVRNVFVPENYMSRA